MNLKLYQSWVDYWLQLHLSSLHSAENYVYNILFISFSLLHLNFLFIFSLMKLSTDTVRNKPN